VNASGCVFVSLTSLKVKQLCGSAARGFRLFWDQSNAARLYGTFPIAPVTPLQARRRNKKTWMVCLSSQAASGRYFAAPHGSFAVLGFSANFKPCLDCSPVNRLALAKNGANLVADCSETIAAYEQHYALYGSFLAW